VFCFVFLFVKKETGACDQQEEEEEERRRRSKTAKQLIKMVNISSQQQNQLGGLTTFSFLCKRMHTS